MMAGQTFNLADKMSLGNMFVFTGNQTHETTNIADTASITTKCKIAFENLAIRTRDPKKPKFFHTTTPTINQPKPFRFSSLPAEIRNMVYSHIILPKHEQPLDTKPSERFNEQYIQQREICHKTAQSLMLVSKTIHHEILPIFYKHKTLVLSHQGKDNGLSRAKHHLWHEMSPAVQQSTTNLAFDVTVTQDELDLNSQPLVPKFFTPLHNLLQYIEQHFHRLKNITIRVYQPRLNNGHGDSDEPADTSIRTTNDRHTILVYDQDTEIPRCVLKLNDVKAGAVVGEAYTVFTNIFLATSGVFPQRQWETTKAVYKSPGTVGKPLMKAPGVRDRGVSYLLHEAVVRRRTP